ncbi:serine/threonine-protein kinase/endoribonuclease IRE1-like isoform X2 [Clavelina lepadiformis]|uniref:serine/threonine-protein kinase/endoribonuclease IRE1-like isoform X2 n=1 Tax=Clavelina lepadiformis TaxID=159417 RepID=UPI004041A0E6
MSSQTISRERKYPREAKSPWKHHLFSKIYQCRKNDETLIIEKRVLKDHVKFAESEAQAFKKICNNSFHHPNVVLYLDAIEDEDAISLYMEKCDGDLEEWTKKGELNACNLTASEICLHIIEGISYLHGQNIIHRDVKPSNFLIRLSDKNATIKVTDFGLSKILATDVSSAPTTSTSTEAFMAPEYHRREDGSRETSWRKSADIFSLGITLYYVLTNGRHPFGDKTSHEAPHNIQQKASPDLDLLDSVDDLSQEQKELAKDLIKKMFGYHLEKKEVDFDPKKRPTIQLVKFHPLFWTSKKKIGFYKEANRWFYNQSRKNAEKYQQALKHFENEFDISINNVPSSLRSERKFPIKECGNVHQLLQKVIRNMDEHGDEKLAESMKLLGFLNNGKRDYDKFLLTLTGPYPGLLAYLWWYLRDEEIEGPYYPMKNSPHIGSTKQGSLENKERRKITRKIEKFQHGWNVSRGYGPLDLLRLYEQIFQISDEQLTTNAAELFPEELDLSDIKLTESQIGSFLFILTKVEKRIEGLGLDDCFSKPEDVGRLFEAIQAMPGKIGRLGITGNIIPKIPSKSFFNKIEDWLIMWKCFPDDDAIDGKRDANQSEIDEIQRVLDQLDDSKLEVYLGRCDRKFVELRSRKKSDVSV